MPVIAISVSRYVLQIPSESFLLKNFAYISALPLGKIGKSLKLLSGYDLAGLTPFLVVLLIQISLEIISNLKALLSKTIKLPKFIFFCIVALLCRQFCQHVHVSSESTVL